MSNGIGMDLEQFSEQAELMFREQSDGRKIARLGSGKIVLVHYDHLDRVKDGETWLVRLQHDISYCVAYPEQLVTDYQPEHASEPAETPPRRAKTSVVRAPEETAVAFEDEASNEEEPMVSMTIKDASEDQGAAHALDASEESAAIRAAAAIQAEGNYAADPRELITQGERVAVFVDAANADAACRDVGYWLDYARILQWAKGDGSLHGGYFYVADLTQEQDSKQTRFLDHLNYAGYVIRLKRVKRIIDTESGEERFKANVDTEIIVDMLNTADTWDVAWLLSGDSDFERLVDILRSRGKRVYVLSSKGVLSKELAYAANQPVFRMEQLQEELGRNQQD